MIVKIKCLWCGEETGEIVNGEPEYSIHKCPNKKDFENHIKQKLNK